VDQGSAEQCDTKGDTNAYVFAADPSVARTCRALGYDYAVQTTNTGADKVTCSLSCAYGGCATCGTPPDKTLAATDPLFQGKIEGELYDTLFQQPVQSARVTLFYRGLQVAVTTSDDKGFFSFSNLDRHDGCNQYKLIIDSYGDNPKTPLFNEALRGGYMPIETPSFMPHQDIASESGTTGRFTDVMIKWGTETKQVIADATMKSYTIPRFNMLPKLKENEYIVQFWWLPFIHGVTPGQEISDTISDFRNYAITQSDGSSGDQLKRAGDYYAAHAGFLHDLVVRLPFTYVPDTYGRCSLSPKPVAYNGTNGGRNPTVTTADMDTYIPGVAGPDKHNAMLDMANCTNKIRATGSKTCTGGNIPASLDNKLACTMGGVDWECSSNLIIKYPYSGSGLMCGGTPEPSRSGPIDVLSGAEGAYLFCYHPEWPEDNVNRTQTSCTNFIIPPQSVFISGKGGQYDILVSAYQAFQSGSNDYPSIRKWLEDNDGRIQVYDQYGFNKEWDAKDWVDKSLPSGWNANDELLGDICLPTSPMMRNPVNTTNNPLSANNVVTNQRMFNVYTNDVSTVWTPFSIDTSVKQVIPWNNGDTGADYRYFADLYTYEWAGRPNPGLGSCWERTCDKTQYGPDKDHMIKFPLSIGGVRSHICSDGLQGYGGDYSKDPACDAGSQAVCPANICIGGSLEGASCTNNSDCSGGGTCTQTECRKTVDSNRKCIQLCSNDGDCPKGGTAFCGGAGLNNDDRCGGPGAVVGR
jgi:hypothetical protein